MNCIVKTSDGHEIKITEEMAGLSNIWKIMLNADFDDDSDSESEFQLPTSVRKELLDKVVEFANFYLKEPVGEIPKPLPNLDTFGSITGIPSWADDWLGSMSKKELQTMIMVANFLDIQSLLHLASAYVAFGIKGKTPDEIKEIWSGIPVNPVLI